MADEPAKDEAAEAKPEEVKPAADGSKDALSAAVLASGKAMHVKVYAPFKVYYDGEAQSISASNETGPFDILPRHHNFMTLLNACDIVVRHERGEEKVPIQRGIMHVKADEVIVFLDV